MIGEGSGRTRKKGWRLCCDITGPIDDHLIDLFALVRAIAFNVPADQCSKAGTFNAEYGLG